MSNIPRILFVNRDRRMAREAADLVHARLYKGAPEQTPKDFVFDLPCSWMQDIFVAICQSHGLVSFRNYGMRRQKVTTIAPPALITDTFEPELMAALWDMHDAILKLTTTYISDRLPTLASVVAARRANRRSATFAVSRNSGGTGSHDD